MGKEFSAKGAKSWAPLCSTKCVISSTSSAPFPNQYVADRHNSSSWTRDLIRWCDALKGTEHCFPLGTHQTPQSAEPLSSHNPGDQAPAGWDAGAPCSRANRQELSESGGKKKPKQSKTNNKPNNTQSCLVHWSSKWKHLWKELALFLLEICVFPWQLCSGT